MKLWAKVLIAMGCGVLVGHLCGENASYLRPIGDIFLDLINMIIVPLVFTSMTLGISNIPDRKKLGRIGGTALGIYISTTVLAIIFGICLASLLEIGSSLNLSDTSSLEIKQAPPLSDILFSIVPKNPFKAFAEGNILQIIMFSLLFGIAMNSAGEKAKTVVSFLNSLGAVIGKLTQMVMEISPFGVFAIMAWVSGSFGLSALLPVLRFVLAYYCAGALFIGIVFCSMLRFLANLKLMPFFRGLLEAITMAFSTCSSSATLPVSIKCVYEKLGVPEAMANFILPLGTALGMVGSALFQGMAVIFVAQAYGIELSLHSIISVVITATLATIGAAGVPGAAFLTMSIVLSSIGVPIEGLAILASVDRIRDMATTVINVISDSACAVYIAKREGELDETRYYQEEEMEEITFTTNLASN